MGPNNGIITQHRINLNNEIMYGINDGQTPGSNPQDLSGQE